MRRTTLTHIGDDLLHRTPLYMIHWATTMGLLLLFLAQRAILERETNHDQRTITHRIKQNRTSYKPNNKIFNFVLQQRKIINRKNTYIEITRVT